MKNTRENLLKKQKKLIKELKLLNGWIEGSLTTVHRICGTKTCSCMNGGAKHKAMFFTWKGKDKKTKSLYVPVAKENEAIQLNKNYKKLKKLLKLISENQKLILKS